jgi:alpha-tubulin suppressor-like RCC1 family protein
MNLLPSFSSLARVNTTPKGTRDGRVSRRKENEKKGKEKEGGDYQEKDSNIYSRPLLNHSTSKSQKISYIACGPHHVIATTEDQELYCWGCNAISELGFLGAKIVDTPTRLELPNNEIPKKVACGVHAPFASRKKSSHGDQIVPASLARVMKEVLNPRNLNFWNLFLISHVDLFTLSEVRNPVPVRMGARRKRRIGNAAYQPN